MATDEQPLRNLAANLIRIRFALRTEERNKSKRVEEQAELHKESAELANDLAKAIEGAVDEDPYSIEPTAIRWSKAVARERKKNAEIEEGEQEIEKLKRADEEASKALIAASPSDTPPFGLKVRT
jgi:hypothetical protein